MTKIAHICTSRMSYKILKDKLWFLSEKGFDVHIISSMDGEDIDFFRNHSIKQHYIEMNREINFFGDIKSIVLMIQLFNKEQFDIVHTHTAKAGFIGRVAAKLTRVPLIVHTSHGLPFFEGQSKTKYHLYKFLEILASKCCHYVGSQNQEDLKTLRNLINNQKLFYEGNGINLTYLDKVNYEITDKDIRALKSQFSIPFNKKLILVGARFEPVKDHLLLLESLKILKEQQFPDFCCLLAGSGPLEAEIKRMVGEFGLEQHIKFLGYQSNIYPWIKMADLVMLTSQKEGIPRILMESMAFHKAVVATNVLGTQELVVHNQTGLLAPYRQAEQFAIHASCLLTQDDLREKYGRSGRQRIERHFTEEIVADRITNLYLTSHNSILNNGVKKKVTS